MLYPESFEIEVATVVAAAKSHPKFGLIFRLWLRSPKLSGLWSVPGSGFGGALCTMAEIPAAVLNLDRILSIGFSRALIGLNDPTQFTMAANRGSNRYPGVPEGMRRILELARTVTARAGAEVALAGGINREHIRTAEELGIDACVVHYSDLPSLFGERYADLPEINALSEIKKWTRSAIHARRRNLGIQPTDPTVINSPSFGLNAEATIGIQLHD